MGAEWTDHRAVPGRNDLALGPPVRFPLPTFPDVGHVGDGRMPRAVPIAFWKYSGMDIAQDIGSSST